MKKYIKPIFNSFFLLSLHLILVFYIRYTKQKSKKFYNNYENNNDIIFIYFRKTNNGFCKNGWPVEGTQIWWKYYKFPYAPSLADIFERDGELHVILNVRYLNTDFLNTYWQCSFNNQLFNYQVKKTDPLKKTLLLIFTINFRGNGVASIYCPKLNISFLKVFFCSISKYYKKKLATACTQSILKNLNLIRSWILWHNINGFSNLTIYVNEKNGADYLNKILRKYVEKGIVSFVNWIWPGPKFIDGGNPFFQPASQMSCIHRSRSRYDWVGMNDLDEFFVSPLYKNVNSILFKYLKHDCGSLRVCNQHFKLPNNYLISDVDQVCSKCLFKGFKQIVKPTKTTYMCVHEVTLGGQALSLNPQELIMAHLKPHSFCKPSVTFKEYQIKIY